MGILRLLFGFSMPPAGRSTAKRAGGTPLPHNSRRRSKPQTQYSNGPKTAVLQPIIQPATATRSSPAGLQTTSNLAIPDPAAQQNVKLPYCRYPKREERAERAKLVYRHACTPGPTILKGKCYVIDGDTISINSVPIRLAGIDAPELDHPYGQASKWAMVKITKGNTITARIAPEMSYDRTVAICCLPDGRDIAAELVKRGLALDWPLFSKGRYKKFEPEGVRRKLWMTAKRQPPPAR